jgi:uncharacterized membrane protein YgcG
MKAWMLSLALFPALLVAGEALSCNNDVDCACGEVCSWATSTHTCVLAVDGGSGWCGTNSTSCLYVGQTCSTTDNTCTPAWSSTSTCNASSGGSSGGSGTTSASDGGSSNGGGGCSSAPGQVGWGAALLALGMLRWSRRRQA